MKKRGLLGLKIAAGVVAAVVLLALAVPPFGMIFSRFVSNVIVSDHSAQWRGQDTIYWNGSYYDYCGETGYREGRTIAKTADRNWDINEVEGDPGHTYIVVRSFLDQYLFVKRDG